MLNYCLFLLLLFFVWTSGRLVATFLEAIPINHIYLLFIHILLWLQLNMYVFKFQIQGNSYNFLQKCIYSLVLAELQQRQLLSCYIKLKSYWFTELLHSPLTSNRLKKASFAVTFVESVFGIFLVAVTELSAQTPI